MKILPEPADLIERIRLEARRRNNAVPLTETVISTPTAAFLDSPPVVNGSPAPDLAPMQQAAFMQLLDVARGKTEVRATIPRWLRPWFRNQGGFNIAILGVLQRLQSANAGLAQDNAALRVRLEQQVAWTQSATHATNDLHARLVALERQNDHDQEWMGSLQRNAEGVQTAIMALQETTVGQAAANEKAAAQSAEVQQKLAGLHEVTQGLTHDVQGLGIHARALQAAAGRADERLSALAQNAETHHAQSEQRHVRFTEHVACVVRDAAASGKQAAQRDAHLTESLRSADDRQRADADYLKNQFWLLERKFSKSGLAPAANEEVPIAASADLDALYLAFENVFRGSRPEIKERLEVYLPYLREAGVGSAERPLLDLGCGRGEWLELLQSEQLISSGIDLNACMIEECRQRMLPAMLGDALTHLATLPDASVGAVTAFHLIEHLPFPVLFQFLRECRRVLVPGGLAIFETPNPANLFVGAFQFYFDPTHQRPLPPDSTRFFVEQAGFARADILPLHPSDASHLMRGADGETEVVGRLNELLYGPRDYAIIGRAAP